MPFENPYNFVPAPPRGPAGELLPDGLHDYTPPGHHRWHPDRFSGEITVRMRVVTPLLLMREREADREPSGHRHLDVDTNDGVDGIERVDLAPTQLKGMLRAVFEAATCSRFGVFSHDQPLGYRAAAEGTALLPALIESPRRIVLPGKLRHRGADSLPAIPVEAWQHTCGGAGRAWLLGGFAHGDEVDALIEPDPGPSGWSVRSLHRPGTAPAPTTTANQFVVRGRLHVTGATIKAKRHERLFVTRVVNGRGSLTQDEPRRIEHERATAMIESLQRLVDDQRAEHGHATTNGIWQRELNGQPRQPWDYLGHEPGKTAWARHLYDVSGRSAPGWVGPDTVLPPAQGQIVTCWAEMEPRRLRPVMISRLRYDTPPSELLDDSLHPAARLDELSAADRVFGWSWHRSRRCDERPEQAAHRGQLRIVRVEPPSRDDAVEPIADLTLEPLSTPKPSQGRFYLGQRRNGRIEPLDGATARPGFFDRAKQALRGRKIYPHHRGLEGLDTEELRRRLRYHPPAERAHRDSQNVTIHEWVRPGAEFTFVLQLADLHRLELGALLWLLDPAACGHGGKPARHRLGMGKPLGFGAVELTVDRTRLYLGSDMATFLDGLGGTELPLADESGLAQEFEQAMRPSFGTTLQPLRTALVGFAPNRDVHYPRNNRSTPIYEWFVQNEEDAKHGNGQSLPLPGATQLEENT